MGFIYSDSGSEMASLDDVIEILLENFSSIEVKRIDQSHDTSELLVSIDSVNFQSVSGAKEAILALSPSAKISFVSAKGLVH